MMARMINVFVLVVYALLAGQPATAQTPRVDTFELGALCARGACVRGVQISVAQIQRLRLSPDDFNSQLGVIAAALFQAASTGDAATVAQLAEALLLLAQYSTDTAQQQSFIWVAGQLSSGAVEIFDLLAPFAVSPS